MTTRRVEGDSATMPLKGDEQTADASGAQAAVEQDLRHQSAEGVAHDDRRRVEAADDRLVVVGDLLEAEALQRRGVLADRLHVAVVDSGPAGGEHGVTATLEALLPALPAQRRHPQAMD